VKIVTLYSLKKKINFTYTYSIFLIILTKTFRELHVSCNCLAIQFGEYYKLITDIISHRYKNFCQVITKSDHNSVNNTYKYKKMTFSH